MPTSSPDELAEVAVEPVVGVLADGAGVETTTSGVVSVAALT